MNSPLEAIEYLVSKSSYSFDDLCTLVAVLRSENGCPWDREQTNKSIRNCFIDETYEFIEGLDNDDNELMCEELGDVLFQIIFHSDIKSDDKAFDVNDVIDGICKKMILRHPHVFGEEKTTDTKEILANWEKLKLEEKKDRKRTLDGIPKLPALLKAMKRADRHPMRSLTVFQNLCLHLCARRRSSPRLRSILSSKTEVLMRLFSRLNTV